MNKELISGIQQVGIGVPNANEAWKWYRRTLGMNVPVFNDEADAKLMTRYTQGEVRSRQAIMALNMAGGGGAEIWQYTKRVPVMPNFPLQLGDLGIFAVKFKCRDVDSFHEQISYKAPSTVRKSPENRKHFWVKDLYGNQLQVVSDDSWFKSTEHLSGGVCGAMIGVSDIDKALKLYADTLGIDEVVYDRTGFFDDFYGFESGFDKYRRVLLRKRMNKKGAFSKLLGNIEIELIQAFERKPRKIFKNRDWGDAGFIHLCFDTLEMDKLKEKCQQNGFLFTVDSGNTFDMGEAGGRFSYIEDPDGTLIEFVETHKVPILKKLGWYLNLKKRDSQKPLPDWMVSTLGWSKVKD